MNFMHSVSEAAIKDFVADFDLSDCEGASFGAAEIKTPKGTLECVAYRRSVGPRLAWGRCWYLNGSSKTGRQIAKLGLNGTA